MKINKSSNFKVTKIKGSILYNRYDLQQGDKLNKA